MSNERHREELERQVRAIWTPERLAELTGGRERPLLPTDAPHLLRGLGILDADGRIQARRRRKYRQLNHLLGFLTPAFEELAANRPLDRPLHVIDAGCGRSALGMLLAWWFHRRTPHAVRVHGVDRNRDAIEGCRERARVLGLPGMSFEVADLTDLLAAEPAGLAALDGRVDAVLALHACDTATDIALALAVRHQVAFFAVAPCCQAELARAWAAADVDVLGPLHHNPHFRRTLGATVTDAMRTALLEAQGYRVRAVEFVEAHHTPKNTLIYGHRTGEAVREPAEYAALKARTGGCGIALEQLVAAPAIRYDAAHGERSESR